MFYPNIAAERAKHRMSVGELADKLGVTRKTIYNWQNAGKIPASAVKKMSEIFNVSADYLLERSDR